MKLTERDVEMFKALGNSGLGKDLIDYLKRLEDYICDVRSWEAGDTPESVKKASKHLSKHLRDKIKPASKSKDPNYPYE
jgi:hypothetical protein